ncbi:hypothetical protein [Streptomyces sp. NBC_01334]|uniref:hypothetical protein n=1 Tax=Streptomyces sp. NBC_01334 TaxID=2903827 RepID=UPI002E106382|nr:hypothetical protein OG736_42750 [Streptomyces sp. NBC_01334]
MTNADPWTMLLILTSLRLIAQLVSVTAQWLVWRAATRTPAGMEIEHRDGKGSTWRVKRATETESNGGRR